MNKLIQNYYHNKTILITGASSGLGRAVVESLAPYRVHFGLLSRREEKLRELEDELRSSGSRFWLRACDVRKREEVETAVREFSQHTGHLDIAWVNSGIGGRISFNHWDWQRFENVIDTNLKGTVYTIIASMQIMNKQNYGTIVGIGSVASMRGLPTSSAYSQTKIGLHYFLETMAIEAPQLQFTIIHPGFVDTPFNQGRPNRIWLMQPQQAAQRMIKAVAKRKRLFIFPWQMNIVYHLARYLPLRFYTWIAKLTISSGVK